MGLDLKKFDKEISKVKRIKASHISDGEANEMLKRSMNDDGTNPSKLDIELATIKLESHGYRINKGSERGYVNTNFGYRTRKT